MKIKRYFTAQEVIACTGITYRRLDYWVRQDIVRASGRSVVRRGCPRLFTFRDMVEIRVAKELTKNGLRLSALKESLRSIRKRLPFLDAPLASERLVTDGKTVFRYLSGQDVLESFDEFGQFAFTFGLKDNIDAVVRVVESMPTPVRYKKRIVSGTG